MTKLRKLAGWLPAVGAMIFNGCVIGWLHCTKPQLLGSSVPGNVIAVGYTILFLLWWGQAPAAAACLFSGPLFPCLAMLLSAELESGTAQETMDTIAHEAFHVQQAYVVENIDWDDAATQAAYYDQARRWLRNDQNGYVSGEEDILGYYFQPVEIDARAYAAEETERLQGLIDKELQKET